MADSDPRQDDQLYQTIASIVGLEKGIQQHHRNDLNTSLLGMAKRLSRLLAAMDRDEKLYWTTHLKKQRLQHGVKSSKLVLDRDESWTTLYLIDANGDDDDD